MGVAIACYATLLDGTHCKVKVVPDKLAAEKGEKEFDDTLSFADGKFSSSVFLAKGFKPATYEYESEDSEADFGVDQTNVTYGVLHWQGSISGKELLGELIWKKEDGTNLHYTFEGTRK